jgi:AcrR family transcriptional regulator
MRVLTREERKDQTRRQLLDAGRRVFLREGFLRASVEEVAAEAGFTTGAVYSAFGGKAELFLAVLDERIDERARGVREAARGAASPEAGARAVARQWVETLRREPDWTLLLIEFWVYAARDSELYQEVIARHRRPIRAATMAMEDVAAHHREFQLLLPVADLARAASAIGHGFALEKLLDPDGVSDDLLEWMFSLFFRAAAPVSQDPTGKAGT